MGDGSTAEPKPLDATRGSNGPAVVSRHTGAAHRRCDVRAWNLNGWCTISGNPFVGPVALMPNHPEGEVPTVEFGPIRLPEGVDSVTFFLTSAAGHEHEHTLRVDLAALDRSKRTLAADHAVLTHRASAARILTFGEAGSHGVSLRMAVSFDEFAGGPHYGKVRLSYLLAYSGNELVGLFNAAGSDKGTRKGVGVNAVPHCYAVEYFNLFAPLRARPFRLLEIGLQSNEGPEYAPTDAPSLSVWRDFFPQAQIYGYDINDFSFFQQDRTVTVQGDQGSREQLERLASTHAGDGFGLVLDDGSHASSHQQISLGSLFRWVEPGGLYVIEDLHWQPFDESPTTLEVLRSFAETGQFRTPFLNEDEARYLKEAIDRVEIHRPNDSEFAVIYKRDT